MQFIWAGIIIAALVIEALSAELISIWFAPAAAISLIVSFFQPDAIWLQVIIFVVLAFIFVLLSRTIFKKHFEVSNVPTNLDTVIGDTAIVVEDICNVEERGAVKLQGKIWTFGRCHQRSRLDKGYRNMCRYGRY